MDIAAASGHASDIKAALNQAILGDSVHIPIGTYNLYEQGETCDVIHIPPGVNLFGAPTDRDINGNVIKWNTILKMPFEAPNKSIWFQVDGTSNPNELTRFSDIALVGYRNIDVNSVTMYTGLAINRILNFRIDHCHILDVGGSAIWIGGTPMRSYNDDAFCGIIDHNRLENTVGHPGYPNYADRTLGYGIGMRRWACSLWEPQISNVFGGYHDYTIFIENNIFGKWRHCIASNDGIHYVCRYNLFEGTYGTADVDAHGSYADASHPYAVGTRAIEVYENIFRNHDPSYYAYSWPVQIRGGGAVVYNNSMIGYSALLYMFNDSGRSYVDFTRVKDVYVWNNDLGGGGFHLFGTPSAGINENEHYFRRPPSLNQEGWEHTPYSYPHPLVAGTPTHTLTVKSDPLLAIPFKIRRLS